MAGTRRDRQCELAVNEGGNTRLYAPSFDIEDGAFFSTRPAGSIMVCMKYGWFLCGIRQASVWLIIDIAQSIEHEKYKKEEDF